MTDPFRPVAPPAFPRPRLTRAGLDEDTLARLESEYDGLDHTSRVEFGRFVTAHSDDAIRDRFSEGGQGAEQSGQIEHPDGSRSSVLDPAHAVPPAPTYEELNALTIDVLEERIREWNATHPEQHLAVSGRKGELIGRLLDAYEQDRQGLLAAEPASEPAATTGTERPTGGTVAEQVLPTAPTATTPEGTPAAPEVPSGAAGVTDTPTGPQEPAQTAATPGAGVAPSTTTEE